MAGPRSPTFFVTAQLISRRWRIVSFWCYADIQQRSIERTFVLPQTHSRALHGVEKFFRLDEMKLFKNIRTDGWVVLPQTEPSAVHVVEESICMDNLQPCKNIQVDGWAALPNILCHGRAHFAALKNRFVLKLCRLSTTFKWADGRAPPNTVERISRFWRTFFLWMVSSFWKTFEPVAGPCSPKHGPVLFSVLKNFFVWMLCSHLNTFKLMAGPRYPTSPCHGPAFFPALKSRFVLMLCRHSTRFKWTDVRATPNTVQGISRCWRIISFGWNETFQKHSNLWLGCAPPNTAQFCLRCWKIYLYRCSAAM